LESHERICDPAQLYELQPGNYNIKWTEGFSVSKQTADCNDILSLLTSTHCTTWINEINSVLRLYFCTNDAMWTAGSIFVKQLCGDTKSQVTGRNSEAAVVEDPKD
jgi:hypothetical protein